MKNNILLLIYILGTIVVKAQNFEGTIRFKYIYIETKHNQIVESPEVTDFFGTESLFITKKGAFKQISNGNYMTNQIYEPIQKRLYYINKIAKDSLFYFNVNKGSNSKFSYEIVKNADTILGYVCDKLIFKDENGQQDVYYTETLKLDPKYFVDFTFGSKNIITELIKSVYLRTDVYFPEFTMSAIATEISQEPISDLEFILPEHKILVEN